MFERLHPGDWITGPFWQGPVQVVACEVCTGYDQVTVAIEGDATRAYALFPADVAQLTRVTLADHRALTFSGNPARFRLAIQAHRLRLAHALNPCAMPPVGTRSSGRPGGPHRRAGWGTVARRPGRGGIAGPR